MKKFVVCLLLSTTMLTACVSQKESNTKDTSSNSNKELVQDISGTNQKSNDSNIPQYKTNQNNSSENPGNTSEEVQPPSSDEVIVQDISEKVKDFIFNGQDDKPEALKLN